MLKLKYLYENFDLAKEALAHWEHDEASLEDMLARFRISSNMVYPFLNNGEVYFLRLSPTEEKLEEDFYAELELLDYLEQRNYPAMRILKTRDGKRMLRLSTKWGEYFAVVFTRAPGEQIEQLTPTETMMFQYGKALGRLHVLLSEFEPQHKRRTHEQILDWVEAVLHEYEAPDKAFTELELLRDELAALPKSKESYGLVHYDFEPDNVFFDAATGECSVIDLDDSMYHWYALDIEQAFDSIEEFGEETGKWAKESFLEGYRSERGYTEEMDRSRTVLRRFVNLYGYARLIRSVAERFEDEPEWLENLRVRLDGAIKAKEVSFRG